MTTTNQLRPHLLAATPRCAIVGASIDVADHHRIRFEVFVAEQAVFTPDDIDEHDGDAATIKVLAFCDGTPAGTVRLFPTSSDWTQWQGDRLAVLAPFRRHRVGAPLVDFAVRTAAQWGGHRMAAHIQVPNVRFFEALGWSRSGPMENYAGLPHQPMAIDVRLRSAFKDAAFKDTAFKDTDFKDTNFKDADAPTKETGT